VAKSSARRPRRSVASTRRPPAQASGQLRYLESSAVVAALLEGDKAARAAIYSDRCATSALTLAEASRAIIRAAVAGRLALAAEQAAMRALRDVERGWFVVDVTAAVLARVAARFPVEPLRSLDAIHLATAELLGEPPSLVTIVTRNARVAVNARALGYPVED